ncbi:MAG: helix-hairpin-helix domain-containing protein [Bacilli bacterium]|nr:helix-hairpin-helix domain-containing protein [Bacilli bacterium]
MVQKLQKNYKIIFLILISFIIILLFLISNKGKITPAKAAEIEFVSDSSDKVEDIIKVDIKGSIVNPGVYEVSSSDRVNDVINKAGGLLEDANTSNINLSKRVKDEMVIVISNNQNVEEEAIDFETNNYTESNNSLVSINSASKEELMSLSGIGESKALAIIKYRENQKFNSIEDIKNVNGIGDSLFEKIKDSITV